MILQLAVPFLGTNVQWARVATWDVAPGDRVSPGDRVCELAVEEVLRSQQDFHPDLFQSILSADGLFLPALVLPFPGADYRVVLISSDTGWMRTTCAAPDDRCEVGCLLGLLSTQRDEDVPSCAEAGAAAGSFRVVADVAGVDGSEPTRQAGAQA